MDLILHIGYPKTGTTTLQKRFFLGSPEFITRNNQEHAIKKGVSLSRLKYFATMHRFLDQHEVAKAAQEWVSSISSAYPEPEYSRVIISDEGLCAWPTDNFDGALGPINYGGYKGSDVTRKRPMPVIEFIGNYLIPEWRKHKTGSVRVILTIRNQADFLASQYAQVSDRIRKASQADFEYQVYRLLNNEDPFIDWYATAKDLERIVGADSYKVLLLEDMGQIDYWNQLAEFVGIPKNHHVATNDLIDFKDNSNRSDGNNCWRLKPLRRDYLSHFMGKRISGRKASWLQRATLKLSRKLESSATNIFRYFSFSDAQGTIMITPSLRSAIRERCSESNESLEKILECDLKSLGY